MAFKQTLKGVEEPRHQESLRIALCETMSEKKQRPMFWSMERDAASTGKRKLSSVEERLFRSCYYSNKTKIMTTLGEYRLLGKGFHSGALENLDSWLGPTKCLKRD